MSFLIKEIVEAAIHQIFDELPISVIAYSGPLFEISQINTQAIAMLKLQPDARGKQLLEVRPEFESQEIYRNLSQVYAGGEPVTAIEQVVTLISDGVEQKCYFTIYTKPVVVGGIVSGVVQTIQDTTETVLTRSRAQNEHQRLIALVENSDDLIGITDMEGNVTYLNRAGQQMMGASSLEECLRPSSDYLFEEEYVRLQPTIEAEMAKNGRWRGEMNYKHFQTGEPILCELNAFIIFEAGTGNPIGMASVTRDLRAVKAAAKEQKKLLTLVENSADLMSILEPNGINSYLNKAGREMLGFESEEQVLTTHISELHRPEDLAQVQKEVLPSLTNMGRWEGQMLVKHLQTGEVFPVYNKSIRIDDALTGETLAVGALMRDMRPELEAQKALADREKLLREITTAAPAGLWMVDERMQTTYVNQIWIDWTGKSLDEHLGGNWFEAVDVQDRTAAKEKFVEDFENKSFHQSQFRITSPQGAVRWIIRTGNPHYSSEGIFLGYIGACVDITELKQLQQQKDEFLGIASHELKTPVTSIKAYTQVLESMFRDGGDTKKADMVKRMDVQVNRLTNLIGDLLDVTKIQSGKLQFNDTRFDFDEMVRELIEDLQRTTKKHTIVDHLQPTGVIFADRERIGQVISNLITNAIKYSPNADKIIVSTCVEKTDVRLCVQDFGIGIPSSKKDRVFEQFYRVSGDEQHTFPGLGLGLYISSEIVKREGGKIWVTSTEGKGSTFCFSIPLNRESNS